MIAVEDERFFLAFVTEDFDTTRPGEKGDLGSSDMTTVDKPIIDHGWGYTGTKVFMRKGTEVYVRHNPTCTAKGDEGIYTYAETWSVYTGDRKVVFMNTAAAKRYLKAKRGKDGKVVYDTKGRGKELADRYRWEMSR